MTKTKVSRFKAAIVSALLASFGTAMAQTPATPLYSYQSGQQTHWISPENPTGQSGRGALENNGAKGHAFETLKAHESRVIADIKGAGIIDRMWYTISDRSPERLRQVKLDIYWDGAKTPAVSVPLGDFFLHNTGDMNRLDTELLASPEARSFISYIAMPYRKSARVVMTNEADTPLTALYFDIDYRSMKAVPKNVLYFHAWWSRNQATMPGVPFEVLPHISGKGRFLGLSASLQTDPVYGKSWWGEGEAQIYLNGDRAHPSLSGTGSEDYLASAWGLGAFSGRYTGAPVADEANGRWGFYRFHIPDPLLFDKGIRVVFQQVGGAPKAEVIKMVKNGVNLIPITIDPGSRDGYALLYGTPPILVTDASLPDGWTNFYRSDDIAAVAYFYQDRPDSDLAPIAPVQERIANLRKAQIKAGEH